MFFLLQFFFGGLGAGRFYSGHKGIAIAQLVLGVGGSIVGVATIGAPIAIGALWAIIDGFVVLIFGGKDGAGQRLR